jgi:hypothetical protein
LRGFSVISFQLSVEDKNGTDERDLVHQSRMLSAEA